MSKHLYRPKKNRILFGVAQGLGEYFDIDPVIIRILFVVLAIWGGSGIVLYIIGIFLIPDENKDSVQDEIEEIKKKHNDRHHDKTVYNTTESYKKRQHDSSIVFGLIILLVGVIFLFNNFLPWFGWKNLWPIILILFGILIIVSSKKGAE